ncbi:DUF4239 domain-containing protein [Streptomyces sp. TLI_146]|uniref:bestrophin-like domain n=1 Tax=Streptomyces sp. TLI_146 TaxID=1938858 RepID=UPI000C7015F2|nr:DUF4239 domain-containing protein [Streptomyces sp. TLI_146]PKV90155.1 uncharacterized protein DUF4239 [Streptomyces sp. TLI_146]
MFNILGNIADTLVRRAAGDRPPADDVSMFFSSLLVMLTAAVAVTTTAFLVTRRQGPEAPDLPKGVEMAVGAVSGLFVFSFAFLALNAQTELNAARKAALSEASALKEVYFAAQGLDDTARVQVRQGIVDYTRSVVTAEWPAMRDGRPDESTARGLDTLRLRVYKMPASDDAAKAARAEVTQRMRDVYMARRERLAEKDAQVPLPILSLMIGAGVATLLVIALFGRPSSRVHYGLLAVGAAGFAYMIFLILALNHPYGGGISIGPDAYREALTRYQQIGS